MCQRSKKVRASELLYNLQNMAGLIVLMYKYCCSSCLTSECALMIVSLLSQGLIARSTGTTVLIERLFESLPVRRGDFIR